MSAWVGCGIVKYDTGYCPSVTKNNAASCAYIIIGPLDKSIDLLNCSFLNQYRRKYEHSGLPSSVF